MNFSLGVACINPPEPPESKNLIMLYETDTIIEFGQNVTYKCLQGFHFEEDYYRPEFNLTCQTNGNFTDPLPWQQCLHPTSKFCFDLVIDFPIFSSKRGR